MTSHSGSTPRRRRYRPRLRKRCDARVKNTIKIDKNGTARMVGLYCRAWAMPNGRCRMHGGASTGPKSPEGKAHVVAAMVTGRRAWAERVRANGRRFAAGRKSDAAWVTEPMRERARAEARRLKLAQWYTPDRALTLALLRSANGTRKGRKGRRRLSLPPCAKRCASRKTSVILQGPWRSLTITFGPAYWHELLGRKLTWPLWQVWAG